ncbi:hypothetical protein EN962_06205 [Mesorhizobium sp. M7A.F.Ca.CA.001.09.2.1]|uniref:Anti-sigma factor n=1 Tax=Mesorhizobium ciceri TaxID=39645 RepID=A0AB38T7W6_9HYPH|nr:MULTISPECIES: hypothetical protein [Mesorhizobium]RUY55743.1 hypothetical protein EN981_06330 [Mesorhizobium sp. M7A.F.Ca.CA.001.13.2.1]MDF3217972.1 hypothetical protein [Mesorhizobium ciceri]RUY66869.1 hypothetical protein EN980_18790 [Mesorhizobium sp. M7A.F.Ca.CA.001.13.1.1]RUY72942.1 hypothetical protein EN965_05580 [Mesorhizobium sp. M7A.F.Ca.CA.001.05.1.1]RUY80245.1 hypothetical protein EN962_06205 [Mesorhizobium sp. M7A.F.Ca.CA.001.09.2.1]
MSQHEIGIVSDWSKLVADDPLIAADITQRLSVLRACNDNAATAADVPSPGTETFRGPDITSLATPIEYPRPIVLLATIYASTVLGVTLLLAAAV